jgi:hypothetical protein
MPQIQSAAQRINASARPAGPMNSIDQSWQSKAIAAGYVAWKSAARAELFPLTIAIRLASVAAYFAQNATPPLASWATMPPGY